MSTPLISFRSGDIQGIIDAYVKRVEIGQGIGIDVSNDKRELEVLRRERDTRYTPHSLHMVCNLLTRQQCYRELAPRCWHPALRGYSR